MKKLSFVLAFIFFIVLTSFSQSFEGKINFRKLSPIDTNNYVYYIKADKVRIDEIDSKTNKPVGSFLIDLKLNTMISLSHERKLYMDQKTNSTPIIKGTPVVTKTKNAKTIQGIKCTEFIVKNKDENTEISFFVSNESKYMFFDKLLKMLNRKDKFSSYFLKITNVNGMFPFMAIQKSLDGKETGRIETLKIENKVLENSIFEIPQGYTKFDK